jgi:uroporphyrinogen decarboxylase
MTHRQRLLATFRFEAVDRPAVDLMEGHIWSDLQQYFRDRHGWTEPGPAIEFLDTDSRWTGLQYVGPKPDAPPVAASPVDAPTKDVRTGPLAEATTVAEVEAFPRHDPAWLAPRDYAAFARAWPDHARILCPGWAPLFWGACEAFGLETALVNLRAAPKLFDAWVQGQHEWYADFLGRAARAARGHCDICWLGDDYAGQQGMLLSPEDWRRFIKPRLAEQIRVIRENGMSAMLHSCGAVRPILGDLVDIGLGALLVFQTSAAGMDARSIARDFGGRLAFYGGIDVQGVLSYGTVAEVEAAVRENVAAFARCGGYVVGNTHHGVSTINGDNIVAMCRAAQGMGAGAGRAA